MKDIPHVCVITTAHPYDDVRVRFKFVKAFKANGFKVSWVGPDIAFFDRESRHDSTVDFHLFDAGKGRIDRLSRKFSLRKAAEPIQGVDVYYSPDPDSAIVGSELATKRKSRAVFDIHEMYHTAMVNHWAKGYLATCIGYLVLKRMHKICSTCDLVLGVSATVLEPYRDVNVEQMIVRSLAPLEFGKEELFSSRQAGAGELTLMHGKGSFGHGTKVILEALATMRSNLSGVKVIILDDFDTFRTGGRDRFLDLVKQLSLGEVVDFRPTIPVERIPDVLRSCDAGLIAYDRLIGRDTLPNRLFEYMALGIPSIAPTYSTEIAKVIEAENCGILVDFEDPKNVADAITYMRANPEHRHRMGERAKAAFERSYNFEVEVQPFINRIIEWKSQSPKR